jgi:hypothetical protein
MFNHCDVVGLSEIQIALIKLFVCSLSGEQYKNLYLPISISLIVFSLSDFHNQL